MKYSSLEKVKKSNKYISLNKVKKSNEIYFSKENKKIIMKYIFFYKN
uniref:Uncharacterized protein n=1 Tax=viral metagenome TaxID=1070528 RepID=A0A6C0ADC1_9ZZZZ